MTDEFTAVDGNECPVCETPAETKLAIVAPADAYQCKNRACPVFKFFGGAT